MSGEPAGEGAFEVVVQPATDRYDPGDDRWLAQASDMYTELDRQVGGVRRELTLVAESKGPVEAVILALGSAGAFRAAVEFFRAWLARDRTRSVEISWTIDGSPQKVVMRGDALDLSVLQPVVHAAAGRIGGAPWAIPATGPS